MAAAQLNELAVSSQQSNNQPQQQQQQPEAPPRSSRQAAQQAAAGSNSSSASGKPPAMQPSPNPLDPVESSDSDSEPEEATNGARNDGTLLASDPPKPL